MKDRIRMARKSAKLTQAELAEKMGCGKQTIVCYEGGSRTPITPIVSTMAKVCGVNENWLLTGEGDMYEPMDKVDEIASIAAAAFNDDDAVRIQLMKIVASLTSEQTEALLNVARQLVEAHEKSSHSEEL